MNLYLLMGTHLPEIGTCLGAFRKSLADTHAFRVFWPRGLAIPSIADGIEIKQYDGTPDSEEFNPDEPVNTFILLDPRAPQIPQLEQLSDGLQQSLIEPMKIITFVDSAAAEKCPKLRSWLDACIYYSDVVLLGNRETTAKSFVRDFEKSYLKKCYPCLFALLKGAGKPDNPHAILLPDSRRISQLFDLPESPAEAVMDVPIEASCDLDLEEFEKDPYRTAEEEEKPAHLGLPNVANHIVESP